MGSSTHGCGVLLPDTRTCLCHYFNKGRQSQGLIAGFLRASFHLPGPALVSYTCRTPSRHSASVNLNRLRRKQQEKPGARKREPLGQSSPQPGARLKGYHAFLAWPPVHACGSIHTVLVYPPCLSTNMHLGSRL